jgi:predicted phage tail protein
VRDELKRIGGAFGGGGGGGSTGITEDPDTLSSTAWAKIKDAICEGEIFGLADQTNPLTCVAFDGTPVQNTPVAPGTAITLIGYKVDASGLGSGYMAGDVLTAVGGTFTAPVEFVIDTPGTGGQIDFGSGCVKHVSNNGAYTVVPPNPVSFSGGSGTGAKIDINWSSGAGSFNFENFTFYFLNGKQHQSYLPGFDAEDDTFGVGFNLIQAIPWVQAFTDPDLDEIRVAVRFPQLESQDASTGAIHGTSVALTFEIQSDGGGYVLVLSDTVTGKASSPYVKNYSFPLAGLDPPWDLRVTRVTADSTSALLHNATQIDSYTLVIYGKLTHPNTALAGIIIDAKQFPGIPSRAYLLKGLIVNVPMNYDPDTREYATDGPGTTAGTWDGTFKLAWTNNPAWCFYDLCINERYGLGRFITGESISKFDLYTIAQYCDELVPNGFGGFEPRFACSLYIQKQEDAMKVIVDMASIFRGLVYYAQGMLTPTQDKPRDVDALFSPANVIGGQFTYSGTSKRARHTVAHVSYNDMTDLGRLKPAVYEDAEQILKFGYNPLQLNAFGCNSLGQAIRLGKWAIRVEKLFTDTVTFATGQEGFFVRPGMVIQVLDPFRYRADFSGRLSSVDSTHLTLDREVTLTVADYYVAFIRPSDGLPITMTVLNAPVSGPNIRTNVLEVAAMAEQPDVGTIWQLSFVVHPPQKFRVISVTPADDATCNIIALLYDASLYVGLDDDPPGDPPSIVPPPKQLDLPRYVAPPQEDGFVFNEYVVDAEVGPQRLLQVLWGASPDAFVQGYLVKYRYENGNWTFLPEVPNAHITVPLHNPGVYEFKIVARNLRGYQSTSIDASYTSMVGDPVTADVPGGGYTGNVNLTSEIPGAVIYYTLDGSDPTDETNMGRSVASGPVAVTSGDTLKAAAKRRGRYTHISTFDYDASACAMPTFSPVPDPHFPLTSPVSLTLATATGGADIYYTDDGTTPDNTKTLYTAPFALDVGNTTIKAIAILGGLSDSPIAVGKFHVHEAD